MENSGQIKYDSSMGTVIAEYANDLRFSNYLEIGTWNGGGSTYCFAKGFEKRVEPFKFASLEINELMYNKAKEMYKDISYIRIFNARILKNEELPSINTFLEMYPNLVSEWFRDDMKYFFQTAYFDVEDYKPEVVLLDGSEYLTYFEFKKLEPTTNVFILDDINTDKCKKIVEELQDSNKWIKKYFVTNERNGWAVFEKVS
jgi:hypothetical protein